MTYAEEIQKYIRELHIHGKEAIPVYDFTTVESEVGSVCLIPPAVRNKIGCSYRIMRPTNDGFCGTMRPDVNCYINTSYNINTFYYVEDPDAIHMVDLEELI